MTGMISNINPQLLTVSTKQMTRLNRYTSTLLLTLLLFSSPGIAETVRYISDDLTVPMRSGTSSRHKILKFLNSGTAVTVLEVSDEEGYTHVRLDDERDGWIKTEYLMTEPSARDQLAAANKKLESRTDEIRSLKETIAELQKQNKELESRRAQLVEDNSSLQQTLVELRSTAANPIAIHEENKQLQAKIDDITTKNQQLAEENAKLNDKSLKEWFIIGAVVALGSILFGLIIPNIRWRKKDSWAGSF